MDITVRVTLYARYSSDLQKPTSIEDQLRLGREYVAARERDNWQTVRTYTDAAISGDSLLLRPDVQALLGDARRGEFDVVWAEALDRLSRDQADIANVFKRLRFYGVKLVTSSEGDVNELHIGLKGTMNALFLRDLASKVHRGIGGRILAGKMCGVSYGYDIVRHVDLNGEPIRGDRKVNPSEAEIVRRILREFAIGASPQDIARRLNEEKIPSPSGGLWAGSTIRGDSRHGSGLINNELYVGKLVWNRVSCPKNPDTGKVAVRVNPPEKWVTTEVPELRIVDDELWQAVKVRQTELAQKYAKTIAAVREAHARIAALNVTHRPRSLLSGLLICDYCGGPYTMRGQDRYRCSNHFRNKSCPNSRTIRRRDLEDRVLAAICGPLLDANTIEEATRACVEEINRLIRDRRGAYDNIRKTLAETQNRKKQIILAIADGGYSRTLRLRLDELDEQEKKFNEQLACAPAMEIKLPPPEIFRSKINHLADALNCPEERDEAIAAIRCLVDRVTIRPECKAGTIPKGGRIALTLYGDLAGLLDHQPDTAEPELMSLSVEGGTPLHRERHPLIVKISCAPVPPADQKLCPVHQQLTQTYPTGSRPGLVS